jgi:hypothetical protein
VSVDDPITLEAPITVDVSGRRVAYRRRGSGPPLVLLHGFTHDSRAWRPQLDDLADKFTVIAVRLRLPPLLMLESTAGSGPRRSSTVS